MMLWKSSKKPVQLKFRTTKKNPTAPANDPAITTAIKSQFKSKKPAVFTDAVLEKITYSKTYLQLNKVVEVQATYGKKPTPIYVKELVQTVDNALAEFNKTHPLEIPYNKKILQHQQIIQ